VPGVKSLIAVASGKGGVGKSTTAVNLALGLKALGLKVGILDADIYGPSQPRLLGLKGQPQVLHGKTLKPMEGYGLKAMSMGFMVDEETPVIWRGPMVVGALNQMLRDVAWGEDGDLDVLVVDMPPGTGDVQLTMAQQVPLSGAVIVSTPQDLALIDARKGLAMFRKVGVPVLGIVENMSTFVCPKCGERSDIFGHGGARSEAERLGVPFLGAIPLDMEIRSRSDSGEPITATAPSHMRLSRGRGDLGELHAAQELIAKPPRLGGPQRHPHGRVRVRANTASAELFARHEPSAEFRAIHPSSASPFRASATSRSRTCGPSAITPSASRSMTGMTRGSSPGPICSSSAARRSSAGASTWPTWSARACRGGEPTLTILHKRLNSAGFCRGCCTLSAPVNHSWPWARLS
jgi:ATP-binding protein involved in chromosome partitioning